MAVAEVLVVSARLVRLRPIIWRDVPIHRLDHRACLQVQRDMASQPDRCGHVRTGREMHGAATGFRRRLDGGVDGAGIDCLTVAARAIVAHIVEHGGRHRHALRLRAVAEPSGKHHRKRSRKSGGRTKEMTAS